MSEDTPNAGEADSLRKALQLCVDMIRINDLEGALRLTLEKAEEALALRRTGAAIDIGSPDELAALYPPLSPALDGMVVLLPAFVERIRELSTPPRDDYDRAVHDLLAAYEGRVRLDAYSATAGQSWFGPYGWLIKPYGVAEDEWFLADDPTDHQDEAVCVPLYAEDRQRLG